MATGIYGRVQARGFPVPAAFSDDAEAVAQASLESQGGTADPAHGQVTYGAPPSTLHGFGSEGPPPPGVGVRGDIPGPGTLQNPDQTPGYGPGTFRTHAAPHFTGFAGSHHDVDAVAAMQENSRRIHAATFGGRKLQDFAGIVSPGGELEMNPSGTEDYGASAQPPLTGAARVLGGKDAVQGYGSLGSGPGGVNGFGLAAVKANRLGITGNVVNAYLDPAERPFYVPQGGRSFIPSDAVVGPEPYASFLAGDGLSYNDPSAYEAAPEPATLKSPLNAATAWGW
jgi:hypothetical protein